MICHNKAHTHTVGRSLDLFSGTNNLLHDRKREKKIKMKKTFTLLLYCTKSAFCLFEFTVFISPIKKCTGIDCSGPMSQVGAMAPATLPPWDKFVSFAF